MTTLAIIGRAMRRALQWRLLVLSPIALAAAALATLVPFISFFGGLLDHSPRWHELSPALDSAALAQLTKALMTPAAAELTTGIETSLVLAVLFAPLLAGAALVVAETRARPRLRALVSGAAGYYGRLLRMQIAALLPLVVAVILVSIVVAWSSGAADRATSVAEVHTSTRIGWLVSAIVVFIAQLVIDAGRARLAAEPGRRSALFALGAGIKLVVKRPLRAAAVGLSATVVALLAAAVLLVLRQQIAQSGFVALLLAVVLAQLAVAAIAWGHAARLCGLVEIAYELAGKRAAARPPAVVVDSAPIADPPQD
ncbi:MAG TPA: hypothetical protein VHW23_37480 [Kofleriaceae bacterium]|jgi:hypothetical protein|nr:hypothetical protein [Kofleriaceae bacterium]